MTDQHNPALVPEPQGPQERTYLVTGQAQETLGHRYGETFTATLPADQEAALLAGGALTVVETAGSGPQLPVDPAPGHDDEASGPDDERRHARKPVPHDRRRKAPTTDTTTDAG